MSAVHFAPLTRPLSGTGFGTGARGAGSSVTMPGKAAQGALVSFSARAEPVAAARCQRGPRTERLPACPRDSLGTARVPQTTAVPRSPTAGASRPPPSLLTPAQTVRQALHAGLLQLLLKREGPAAFTGLPAATGKFTSNEGCISDMSSREALIFLTEAPGVFGLGRGPLGRMMAAIYIRVTGLL